MRRRFVRVPRSRWQIPARASMRAAGPGLRLHAAGRLIDMDEAHARAVDQVNSIRGRVHGRGETKQRLFAASLFGDVDVHDDAARRIIRQRRDGQQKPVPPAEWPAGIFHGKTPGRAGQDGADARGGPMSVGRIGAAHVVADLEIVETDAIGRALQYIAPDRPPPRSFAETMNPWISSKMMCAGRASRIAVCLAASAPRN